MGINKDVSVGGGAPSPSPRQSSTPTKSSIETLAAAAVAAAAAGQGEDGYSSLIDIGQAYGIWNPGEESSNDLQGPRDLKIVEEDGEDGEDEEDDIGTANEEHEHTDQQVETS